MRNINKQKLCLIFRTNRNARRAIAACIPLDARFRAPFNCNIASAVGSNYTNILCWRRIYTIYSLINAVRMHTVAADSVEVHSFELDSFCVWFLVQRIRRIFSHFYFMFKNVLCHVCKQIGLYMGDEIYIVVETQIASSYSNSSRTVDTVLNALLTNLTECDMLWNKCSSGATPICCVYADIYV